MPDGTGQANAAHVAPGALRRELRRLASLAIPVAFTQLSTMMLGVVDTIMVGHVDVDALAAAALANVWAFGTIMFANGILFGLDPLMAQGHGAGASDRVAIVFQRGLVLALLLSLPVAASWMVAEPVLVLAGQDPGLAALAQQYMWATMPGIPFFLLYSTLRQYLQARELVRPALWIVLMANVFNVAANWVFIFGHLGVPALGLVGAGIATSLTRVFSLAGLVGWVWWFGLQRGAWLPWSRAALEWSGMRRILAVGLPVAVQTSTEMWAFSAGSLMAGTLGATALAAHTIAMNLASVSFMLPLGVAQGATTRVGNLIGARQPALAQRSAWLAMAMGGGVMLLSATLFVVGREWLPLAYSNDPGVLAAAATILPIAAAFQIFDGTQVVGCGVLRGMGRTRPAAVFNLIGYWLLGLPIGAWLGLYGGGGLEGIWWGLVIGLAVVALSLVAWLRVRGPAHSGEPIAH